jgi:hypothetical protein
MPMREYTDGLRDDALHERVTTGKALQESIKAIAKPWTYQRVV